MNARQVIEQAMREWGTLRPGTDACATAADHIAHRLREAGLLREPEPGEGS